MHDYSYSATKGEDGRFYGSVYYNGGENTETVATIDGIRSTRGVKAFAKSAAQSHRAVNRPINSHGESHYVHGALTV